ncbi:hypothetical protein C3L33_05378, partial [Rhododendron williamsianum]
MANPRESQAAVSSTTNSSSRPVGQPVNYERIFRINVYYCFFWGLLLVLYAVVFSCAQYFIGRHSSPKFQISSFSVSPGFNTSSCPSSLLLDHSDWKITFLVRNPTRWDPTSYGQLEVSLLYHGVSISSTSVSPFHLHKEDKGLVAASMATILPVDNNVVVGNINDDLKDGAVNFTVAVNGTVRWLKSRPWRGDWHDVTVSCYNVMVGFYGNNGGALVGGGSAECKAHVKIGFWEFP